MNLYRVLMIVIGIIGLVIIVAQVRGDTNTLRYVDTLDDTTRSNAIKVCINATNEIVQRQAQWKLESKSKP